ncbi:facilitated trehalose transporter Tret1-like [Neodiprion fabricii]|uniref:facilitated trehalose transporter Tret1-like n=1 Tax=Neodiprion fabricii TaxID=2872261 RepID=UPI001ED8EDB9|nr:facilitated trehalose transporter Tret1-like [Neodiprion fabricii]
MIETCIKERPHKRVLWLQWIGGLGALLLLFISGLMIGWTSPYIAKLTTPNSTLHITKTEASWVASLMNFGRLTGAVPGAASVYYFGGKQTLFFITIPMIVGWISIIMANSVVWLYIARFVSGLSMGMSYSSFPLYLGEIASPKIRGSLVTLASCGAPVGMLCGNIIGAYVDMPVFAYISLVPTVVAILLFLWLPESPHHLLRTNQIGKAEEAIARYNPGINIHVEVKSIQNFLTASNSQTFRSKLREFNIPQNRKAGLIIIGLYLFMQLSGLNSVLFYLETILTNGGLTFIPPATMVMVGSGAAIFGAVGAIYLAAKCKRKTLLIVSCVGTVISLGLMGTHFALLNGGTDSAELQWLITSSVLMYEVSVHVGLCPVPSIVLSELFAPNIKSMAACIASVSVGLFAFLSSKTYQPLVDMMGEAYVFWMHASFIVIEIIFVWACLLETKGKSLQEIQNALHKR